MSSPLLMHRYTTQVMLIVDIIYLLALPVIILFAGISRLKGHPKREGISERLGYGVELDQHPNRVLLHAVSVGEVNAIRKLVALLDERRYEVVLCVTTDTGIRRAKELYGEKHVVTRYPIDFSFAVKRFINRIKPTIIGLVELEVWPNFIHTAKASGIPVVIVNGRLSERSFSRYALIKPFLKGTFKKVSAIGVQTELYAERVRALGGQNVTVEGTMKWDNATMKGSSSDAEALRGALGIDPNKLLIVAGSTAPEEHQLLREACPEDVQLLCAPRRPEWFDEAAKVLAPCNRRSSDQRVDTNFFLLDTIGELNIAYQLADIVVIGRSFAPMHGSDPSQSVALQKPTIIGPNTSDFTDMVEVLVDAKGLLQIDRHALIETLLTLANDEAKRSTLALNGFQKVNDMQGATQRYADLIEGARSHG